ncbi:hypothetical protein SAMN02746065_11885 [Desulfocicer vacuolatum DSM 3385]|uniref:Uncharacterized protein n=1 Tax=Desulfocicer vacuolatum DSM 3385 TaxID=1121400 RepID=A0A1W2DLC2_9BACT|nr:hypothetical protein SAMN02746065_11885 [Desulfocicer vacuolatum DSM 3385]
MKRPVPCRKRNRETPSTLQPYPVRLILTTDKRVDMGSVIILLRQRKN